MNKLASLNLTLWSLGAIVVCLLIGMILAQIPPTYGLVALMNKGLVLDWFIDAVEDGAGSAALAMWFLALCGSVGLLVLNLAACTYTRLWPRMTNGHGLHRVLLFLVHVLMIVILVGHLSQMTMGFKDESIRLLPGDGAALTEGVSLILEEVTFVDSTDLLNLNYRQGRNVQTTTAFHRESNTARVAVWRDGVKVGGGVLRILEPLKIDGMRLTLSDFYLDEDSGTVGAIVAASGNPFTGFFFAAYLAWIIVYVALAALSCNPEEKAGAFTEEATL